MSSSSSHGKKVEAMRSALPSKESIIAIPGTNVFLDCKSGLLKGDGNHLYRTWYNQANAYRDMGLRVVFGSLGFGGEGQEPFFEHGGADRLFLKDFVNPDCIDRAIGHTEECLGRMETEEVSCFGCKKGDVFGMDMYCWLEDEDEKVYDVFELEWMERAEDLGKHVAFRPFREIRGKTRAHLKRNHGLHYVKAPDGVTQLCLERYVEREFRHQYEKFIRQNQILNTLK